MTIVYRTTGPWGSGKGSFLTKTEGDNNTYEIVTRIAALESALPAAAVGISSIGVSGDQMSIILSDATTEGPFTLPTTTYPFIAGGWTAFTPYNKFMRFNVNGGLYEVLFSHTSAATFDANANDGSGHNYYGLLLSNPGATFPTGGMTGSFLVKASTADFDFELLAPGALSIPFTAITGTATAAQLPVATTSAIGAVKRIAAVSHNFMTSIDSTGLPILAQPAFTDISGVADPTQIPPEPIGALTTTGTATADITMANVYTRFNAGSNLTLTIPPSSSVAWVANTKLTFRVVGAGQLTLSPGAGVTINIPTGFIAQSAITGSVLILKYVGSNVWDLYGFNLHT